jgi:hypothetical protein
LRFDPTDMAMVTFTGFVVVPQNAFTGDDKRQPVLEAML